MSAYDPGTSTPNRAGLVEIAAFTISGDPFRINDGTFELIAAPGLLWGSAAVSDGVSPLSNDHGGYAGKPLYTPREFSLVGRISVPTVDDLWGAIDILNEAFNLADTSLKTLTLDTAGWAATRQIAARVAGEISIPEPADLNGHFATRRQFTVPMIAPDPRIYSSTLHTVTVTAAGTAVANAGKMPTPFTARFNAAQTGPLVLTDPNSDTITYSGSPASGYVDVNTRGAVGPTATAVTDGGVNKFSLVTDWSARLIAPGSGTYTATNAGGAGTTQVLYRDAWL